MTTDERSELTGGAGVARDDIPGQAPERGRRTLLRRAVGFVVGFAAALAIIVATEVSQNAGRVETRVVGELDVFEHCRGFELEAALRDDDAEGWRCVGRRNGIWGFEEVDFDAACRGQHGGDATARTDDPSSPYAWHCVVSG